MPPLKLGSLWRYIGKATGQGEQHMVVALGEETDNIGKTTDKVITLSQQNGIPSHSWYGETGQFWLEFVKAN